jgi:hypothetical protein
MKQFSVSTEEALFRMIAHRDRALHYKMEEVQITAVDELYLEQDKTGHVCRQIARVRIFFLGFISGEYYQGFLLSLSRSLSLFSLYFSDSKSTKNILMIS